MDTNNIKDAWITGSVAATPVIVTSMDIVSDVLSITLLTCSIVSDILSITLLLCSIIYTVIRIYKEGTKEN